MTKIELAKKIKDEHNVNVDIEHMVYTHGDIDDVYGWEPIPEEWLEEKLTKKTFDDAYGKVYDENGEFLFSYYECGIDSSMSESLKNKLVSDREDYLAYLSEEQDM